jgi:formylglycine-generating enzyme required for sulfatase activity
MTFRESSFKIWVRLAAALLLIISSSSFARAQQCSELFSGHSSGLFQNPIRLSDQVDETIRQLARLRLRVDLAQTEGKSLLLMNRLRADFERKKGELVELVEGQRLMTRAELGLKLRLQITELQSSVQNKNHIEEENRRGQERSLREDLVVDGSRAIFYRVEPANFAMYLLGRPNNSVEVQAPFEMMATTVTQSIWKKVAQLANGPALSRRPVLKLDPSGFKGDLRPVENVSYLATRDWIDVLNELSASGEPLLRELIVGHKTGDVYRLPTEEEWGLVIRGRGTFTGEFHFGDVSLANEYTWSRMNSRGESHPVAQKKPVVIGNARFFDMGGNVSQWMQIPLNPTESQKTILSGGLRFTRGGSWRSGLNDLRTEARDYGRASNDIGFRLVRVVRP